MNRATQWLETAAYAVVSLLGAWLVWQKALRPWWGARVATAMAITRITTRRAALADTRTRRRRGRRPVR